MVLTFASPAAACIGAPQAAFSLEIKNGLAATNYPQPFLSYFCQPRRNRETPELYSGVLALKNRPEAVFNPA